ncbi:UNVERIFIED_CONTAM: hypothetical protein Sradi_4723700, partial [Sesamum radiatum]
FARSPEEDEDKETTSYPGHSSQAIQVHGTAEQTQEAILSRCVPLGTETQQHYGGSRLRVLIVCCSGSCWEWAKSWALCKSCEKSQSLAVF